MQIVSEKFITAMENRPYIAKITVDGIDVIQGDPIKSIDSVWGANSEKSSVTIGCAVASSMEIELDKSLIDVELNGRNMEVELGQEIDGDLEWLSMGTYKVTDLKEGDGSVTAVCENALAHRFNNSYEDVEEFDFTSEEGVSSIEFLKFICNRRGVVVDANGLEDIRLHNISPSGYAERKIIGMLAGLYGKFAVIDRSGVLRFKWYIPTDVIISADDYYEDEMEKAGYDFTLGWLKCYNESMEETMVEGDPDATQGIYFECPWMTDERLTTIWNNLQGFSYRPVTRLEFLGDPRLDPGDIVQLKDCEGVASSVPIMEIRHEFDGGLRTEIAAQGQAESDVFEGPIAREVKRTTAKIIKKQNEIEMAVDALESKVEENAASTTEQITQMVQSSQSIIFTALEEYARTSDLESLKQTVSAQLAILANEVNISVTEQQEKITSVNDTLQQQINEITANYRFTADGQYIGKTDSDTMLRLINDMMQILVAGVAATTVDRTGLTAEQVNVKVIHMGDYTLALGADGHLSLT